jgi:hypothetical protein
VCRRRLGSGPGQGGGNERPTLGMWVKADGPTGGDMTRAVLLDSGLSTSGRLATKRHPSRAPTATPALHAPLPGETSVSLGVFLPMRAPFE